MGCAIEKFRGISLSEMDSVKLMNRTDQKYWFHGELLEELLEDVAKDYYLLEVDGERNLPYATTYYDTMRDEMYGDHHRGKLNRYKIRRRNYISTNSSFLEVKFKSNKGRTIKIRRASDYGMCGFDDIDRGFIKDNSPYRCEDLESVLENKFHRLMLVSKRMDERCTIDSQIRFVDRHTEVSMGNLVVVEVKRDGRSPSIIVDALNRRGVKPSGFSKYCLGRSVTDNGLKQNNFKRKHREIAKKLLTILK